MKEKTKTNDMCTECSCWWN